MVLIKSPKGIWRNQRDTSEWLEYTEGQIIPASPEEMEKEINAHSELILIYAGRFECIPRNVVECAIVTGCCWSISQGWVRRKSMIAEGN